MAARPKTTAELHVERPEIQRLIKGFVGCPALTGDGTACRPSLVTNRFRDPVTKRVIDCNWYCLRGCSEKRLLPIFRHLPTQFITRDGRKHPVVKIWLAFYDTNRETGPEFIWRPRRGWGKSRKSDMGNSEDPRTTKKTPEQLSEILCDWFRAVPEGNEVRMSAEVSADNQSITGLFKALDIPYLRPNWEQDENTDNPETATIEISLSTSAKADR